MDLDVQFLVNEEPTIGNSVVAALDEYADAFFAVAYGTHAAFTLCESTASLTRFLKSGHRLRVLLDADRHFTDPDLITELSTFPGDVECRLFAPRTREPAPRKFPTAFHLKVYYFTRDDRAAAIVGSANFSPGGLRQNLEAAIQIRGPAAQPVLRSIQSHLEGLWTSPYQIGVLENPGFMEVYERAYAAAREREVARPLPTEAPIYQSSEDVSRLRDAFAAAAQPLLESTAAYIVGLISGGWAGGALRQREITIYFRRGLLNRGTERAGQIFFEDVSERALDQRDCVRRDAERILNRLQRAFERLGTGEVASIEQRSDFSYRIILRFRRNSPVWRAVRAELVHAGTDPRYYWPRHLDFEQQHVRRSFLQGYMDLRTRISATDALPKPAHLMRVAVSIGRDATSDFPERLRQLIATELECDPNQINLLQGAGRDRESLIRIDARLLPANFLESHWQRIVVEDFREYNAQRARS